MSAFNEHFLKKYFAYRRRYVDFILAEAPRRAQLAVAAEIARLGFMLCGNALCALILWALAGGAAARSGLWSAPFAALAALPTFLGALTLHGLAAAVRDRARIRAGAAAAAHAARG